MSKDNVLALKIPGVANEVSDVLTLLLDGAQQLLARKGSISVSTWCAAKPCASTRFALDHWAARLPAP